MYRLRGVSGEEIGPYSVEQIRALLRAGRVSLQALARAEGESIWRPLDEIPAFASLSLPSPETWSPPSSARPQQAVSPPPAGGPPPLTPSPAPPLPSRTSRLAVASVCVGFFGFMILPGIIGFCLGVGGLVATRRSAGRIKGAGLAVFGMLLSLFTAVSSLMIAGFFIANQQRWQPRPAMATPVASCWQNLPKLGAALRQYANDHGDILPASTNWCESVRDFVPSLSVFSCPGASVGATSIFALNEKVGGMNMESVHSDTVLLFEVDGGWNRAGGSDIAAEHGISPGLVYIYTAGGQVRQIPRRQLSGQRWDP
ncbi:MAG: DUF4339 domain-containing protein [Verrucomicrobia bacterium]|nr:DUF4339 domain-containing protein [Verrucomicrobiota bacterium]MBI3867110.1 DUF4339 domain-containing protein [Verrucomicrobiota bacterium]